MRFIIALQLHHSNSNLFFFRKTSTLHASATTLKFQVKTNLAQVHPFMHHLPRHLSVPHHLLLMRRKGLEQAKIMCLRKRHNHADVCLNVTMHQHPPMLTPTMTTWQCLHQTRKKTSAKGKLHRPLKNRWHYDQTTTTSKATTFWRWTMITLKYDIRHRDIQTF